MECLCYTKEKSLFTSDANEFHKPEGCLFIAHNIVYKQSYKFEIPDEDFTVVINTKFGGYKVQSWHYAQIYYKGKVVLNSEANTISILNKVKVDYFSVKPGDWIGLFNIIIKVWNSRNNMSTDILEYINRIDSLLDLKPLFIKSTIQHESKPSCWKEPFVLLLHASDILADYLCKFELANICTKDVLNANVELCSKFIMKLNSNYCYLDIKQGDSRVDRLSDNYLIIVKYLRKQTNGYSFLGTCLYQKAYQ